MCEMDQFLEQWMELEPGNILQQMRKIYNIYLSPHGTAQIDSIAASTRRELEECVTDGRFQAHVFSQAKHDVERHITATALRAYWDYQNGSRRGHTLSSLTLPEFQFSDVEPGSAEPQVWRSFLLFLLRDRRHLMLLFWTDLFKAGVPVLTLERVCQALYVAPHLPDRASCDPAARSLACARQDASAAEAGPGLPPVRVVWHALQGQASALAHPGAHCATAGRPPTCGRAAQRR